MSLARVRSRACLGVTAPEVSVEVHLGGGLPFISMVGLPETAVREAKDRVKSALSNSGFEVPARRITISLAPAELPKMGGGFDLPIALGILAASRQVCVDLLEQYEFLGELSLGGQLRPVRGVLPAAMRAADCGRGLVVPKGNYMEASLLRRGERFCAASLAEVAGWLGGQGELAPVKASKRSPALPLPDMADVLGQPLARRAIEVAAAGGHNLLMSGPPGTGKTMLASRIPGLLPRLGEREALEAAAIASISPQGLDIVNWRRPPFRAPHHTCSGIALVGGGSQPRPGEISLAHRGVLFLDELPEFSRHVLEVLREPLESGKITISRAARQAEFPASFQLVCAMNPCPCGLAGDGSGRCCCSAEQIHRYRTRVSGPLLDRIDIQIEVPRPETSIINPPPGSGEPSAQIRERVAAARKNQFARSGQLNAQLSTQETRKHCAISTCDQDLLETAAERHALSPRAVHRILKLARTIADLEGEEKIGHDHLAEAIALRRPPGSHGQA